VRAPPATANPRIAYLLLTLSSLAFGGTWVAGKVAVGSIAPMLIATARFAIASVLLWGWARSAPGTARRVTTSDLPLLLALGLTAPVGGTVLFVYGLRVAPASDGAIITPGIGPILTAAAAAFVQKERVGPRGAAGFVVALAGLGLVMQPGGQVDPERLTGDLFFLASAACWAAYALMGKVATARFTPIGATLYATVTATALLVPFAVAEGGWASLVTAPRAALGGLLYLGAVGTALSFAFVYEGINRIGVTRAAAFVHLIPIFGVCLSALILGERVTWLTAGGGTLVLLGLWLVQRGTGPVTASPGATPAPTL
jgi:drug/metabolite transporter (DMT)-like permease